jgi:hypothetical protein
MDEDLHARIDALVAEEHALRTAHGAGAGLTGEELARMQQLEIGLDRAWDLLRQRQARRTAGQDPQQAQERSADVVERYLG